MKGPISLENRGALLDGFSTVLLFVMFVVMLSVTAFALLSAIADLNSTRSMLERELLNVAGLLKSASPGDPNGETLTALADQLETRVRGSLDSNTSSFLFQLYTASLVTAGVYILARSRRTVSLAQRTSAWVKKRTQKLPSLVEQAADAAAVNLHIAMAVHYFSLLARETEAGRQWQIVPKLNDSLKYLADTVKALEVQKLGLASRHRTDALAVIRDLKERLSAFGPAEEHLKDTAVHLADECEALLCRVELSEVLERWTQEFTSDTAE